MLQSGFTSRACAALTIATRQQMELLEQSIMACQKVGVWPEPNELQLLREKLLMFNQQISVAESHQAHIDIILRVQRAADHTFFTAGNHVSLCNALPLFEPSQLPFLTNPFDCDVN